jgi:hypothetical protein
MTDKNTHTLAERIARLLEDEDRSPDLTYIQRSIEKINERLATIESSLNAPLASRPIQITHASQDKFAIAEAIADEIFSGMQKEKACTFEPNGKPCDHCSMCSSRGF